MNDIQEYYSRVSDSSTRKFGTFSYLPPFDRAQVVRQIQYLVDQGWTPAIEHVEPERAQVDYWYMWRLPMFGAADADAVLANADACHDQHPHDHVRIIGYDSRRQSIGASIVVYRGK